MSATAGPQVAADTSIWAKAPAPESARSPLPSRACAPVIGNHLAEQMPGFGIWPCFYCNSEFTDADTLKYTLALTRLHDLAQRAGWVRDIDNCWTCPDCQQTGEWLGRQYPVAVSGGPAAGAVIAVDVMLASRSYQDIGLLFDAAAARARAAFDAILRSVRGRPAPGRHRAARPGRRAA